MTDQAPFEIWGGGAGGCEPAQADKRAAARASASGHFSFGVHKHGFSCSWTAKTKCLETPKATGRGRQLEAGSGGAALAVAHGERAEGRITGRLPARARR